MRSHPTDAVTAALSGLVESVREWCAQQTDVGTTSLSRLADELVAAIDSLRTVDESAIASSSIPAAKPVRARTAKERRVALSGGIDATP